MAKSKTIDPTYDGQKVRKLDSYRQWLKIRKLGPYRLRQKFKRKKTRSLQPMAKG